MTNESRQVISRQMIIRRMSRRTLLAIGAWWSAALAAILIGVAAIQYVGASIVGKPADVRSQSEIAQALDTEPLQGPVPPFPTDIAEEPSPSPSSSPTADDTTAPDTTAPDTTGPDDTVDDAGSTPSTRAPRSPFPPPTFRPGVRREFPVGGGIVVAECLAGKARLVSWSPGRDFKVDEVNRGPDDEVKVEFDGPDDDVKLKVHCAGGVPQGEVEVDDD